MLRWFVFVAVLSAVPVTGYESCGGAFNGLTGIIEALPGDNEYYCKWTIDVGVGKTIKMTYKFLDLMNCGNCISCDSFEVYSIWPKAERHLESSWCRPISPPPVVHYPHKIEIVFRRKIASSRRLGVSASWQAIDVPSSSPYCPPVWTLHGKRCFRLYQTAMTWQGARNKCRSEGGHFATIPDRGTEAFIAEKFRFENTFWIGLNQIAKKLAFEWVDSDTKVTYTNWAKGWPKKTRDCGFISLFNIVNWKLDECWDYKYFLCEKESMPATTTITPPTTTEMARCFQTFHKSEGFISSPNYPTNYPNSVFCRWEINPLAGINITLDFNPFFHLEISDDCAWDYVQMFRGNVSLGKWCGDSAPQPLASHGEKLVVVFKSDTGKSSKGFFASWKPSQ